MRATYHIRAAAVKLLGEFDVPGLRQLKLARGLTDTRQRKKRTGRTH
jgi:hypothetical protein